MPQMYDVCCFTVRRFEGLIGHKVMNGGVLSIARSTLWEVASLPLGHFMLHVRGSTVHSESALCHKSRSRKIPP